VRDEIGNWVRAVDGVAIKIAGFSVRIRAEEIAGILGRLQFDLPLVARRRFNVRHHLLAAQSPDAVGDALFVKTRALVGEDHILG
jgi:hypothetical protein